MPRVMKNSAGAVKSRINRAMRQCRMSSPLSFPRSAWERCLPPLCGTGSTPRPARPRSGQETVPTQSVGTRASFLLPELLGEHQLFFVVAFQIFGLRRVSFVHRAEVVAGRLPQSEGGGAG